MKERKFAKTLAKILVTAIFFYARYAEKFFTQIYRDLYGDAMLVKQKHVSLSFATKAWIYPSWNSKTLK